MVGAVDGMKFAIPDTGEELFKPLVLSGVYADVDSGEIASLAVTDKREAI